MLPTVRDDVSAVVGHGSKWLSFSFKIFRRESDIHANINTHSHETWLTSDNHVLPEAEENSKLEQHGQYSKRKRQYVDESSLAQPKQAANENLHPQTRTSPRKSLGQGGKLEYKARVATAITTNPPRKKADPLDGEPENVNNARVLKKAQIMSYIFHACKTMSRAIIAPEPPSNERPLQRAPQPISQLPADLRFVPSRADPPHLDSLAVTDLRSLQHPGTQRNDVSSSAARPDSGRGAGAAHVGDDNQLRSFAGTQAGQKIKGLPPRMPRTPQVVRMWQCAMDRLTMIPETLCVLRRPLLTSIKAMDCDSAPTYAAGGPNAVMRYGPSYNDSGNLVRAPTTSIDQYQGKCLPHLWIVTQPRMPQVVQMRRCAMDCLTMIPETLCMLRRPLLTSGPNAAMRYGPSYNDSGNPVHAPASSAELQASRTQPRASQDAYQGTDVLQAHRRRNRASQPPAPARLRRAQDQQERLPKRVTAVDSDSDSNSPSPAPHKPKGQQSTDDDTKEKYYCADYQRSMKTGKFMYMHLTTHILFPDPEKVLPLCVELAFKCLKQCQRELRYPLDWSTFEKHKTGMAKYIRTGGSNFRNIGKNVTRCVVDEKYKQLLLPSGRSQAEKDKHHKDEIDKLLKKSSFCAGTAEGKRTDFAHEAIKGVIEGWIWKRNESGSIAFYRHFARGTFNIITIPLVAAAATMIRNVLEEKRYGVRKLSRKLYNEYYETMLETAHHALKHPTRGPHIEAVWDRWMDEIRENLNDEPSPEASDDVQWEWDLVGED
ncbi:hypothetical protein C8R44DRAFT_896022 [Mycena epipterygia]|nr:hypothetical protein C8R44DRAFT_896022 [Mycena epipterygia]